MKRLLAVCLLGLVLASSSAEAAVSYELFFRSPSFADDSSAIVVAAPGQRFNGVDVLLREIVTEGDSSFLATANLNSFGIDITASGSDGAFLNFTSDTTGGGSFAGSPSNITFVAFGAGFGSPGKTPVLGTLPGTREVRLGSVDLVAPSSGETIFTLLRQDGEAPGSLTSFAGDIVPSNGGTFTNVGLTVTAIPEPSSIAAIAALGVFGAFRLHRKRKLAKTGDV